jgi:alpha-L-fucosidase 2
LRNGFHANGDQTKSGFSGFTYRPFTLEGNFLAMQAVQEMLLQSWSAMPGQRDTEVVRIFPSTPWSWHNTSFENLRAEGGWMISAQRTNNATVWFKISATRNGLLRIRDNFGGREIKWNVKDVVKTGDNFEIKLKAGQSVEAEMAVPEIVPEAPADVARPVTIKTRS